MPGGDALDETPPNVDWTAPEKGQAEPEAPRDGPEAARAEFEGDFLLASDQLVALEPDSGIETMLQAYAAGSVVPGAPKDAVAGIVCSNEQFLDTLLIDETGEETDALLERILQGDAALPAPPRGLLCDVGARAVWATSSAKENSGVAHLRDRNPETFWQSDGPQPHSVTIRFPQPTTVHFVALLLSYAKDESYTPESLRLFAGTCAQDLECVLAVTLRRPQDWIILPVHSRGAAGQRSSAPLQCHMLQLLVESNHQLGKDCHIRGMALLQLSPGATKSSTASSWAPLWLQPWFQSDFEAFDQIR